MESEKKNTYLENDDKLLLSQVEPLKEEEKEEGSSSEEITREDAKSNEEILKELKKVKQQNTITHCLLSGALVLIVAWQISEVSLILKIKGVSDGLANPFRRIGGLFGQMFKRPLNDAVEDIADSAVAGVLPPPPAMVPEIRIPHLEFPELSITARRQDDDCP